MTFPSQWGLSKVAAPSAWDVNTGSNSVVFAILDLGIQLDHPDLQNRLWINPGEIPGDGIDDDNNTYIDDVQVGILLVTTITPPTTMAMAHRWLGWRLLKRTTPWVLLAPAGVHHDAGQGHVSGWDR